MSQIVQVERAIGRPVAVVRRRVRPVDLSRVVPEACGLVFSIVKAAQTKDIGRQVALYRDAGDGLLDIEVGVETVAVFPGCGEVVASSTPAGDAATAAHFGPYEKLGEAHAAIRQWRAATGRAFAGVNWEIYGHWQNEWINDPSKIRTDVYYLLADEKQPA